MQKTMVIGHLGRDAEVKTVNGKEVINFSVCHSKSYVRKDTGQKVDEQVWFDCALWERSAVSPFLKKGIQVYVEGEVGSRPYADKDGELRSSLTLRVEKLELLSSSRKENDQKQQQESNNPSVSR